MTAHLVWFREDLRTVDNTALVRACEDPAAAVYGLFIATPQQWRAHDMAPLRQRFLLRNMRALAQALGKLNIPLVYLETPAFDTVPELVEGLVRSHGISAVFANREYGWNEKQRDAAVAARLAGLGCAWHACHDQGMLPPGQRTGSGTPYTVFTPFRKCWLEQWRAERPPLLPAPRKRRAPPPIPGQPLPEPPLYDVDRLWPAGEAEAQRRLEMFCEQRIVDYKDRRDFPAAGGTSVLSPWLAAGAISPRQCLQHALEANDGRLSGGLPGVDCWISELVWRDFYLHILDSFPRVSKHRAFRAETETIAWRDSEQDLQAWCEGRTGIPIVDAAMRQLVQTGWMHNRLRMVTAMFLSKQLLIDWRRGERFFMQHLIDGTLASNNGGWQWAASTGTDAAPYFRVFNPVTQSRRFDPDGEFIRNYVPELRALPDKDIHLPPPVVRAAAAPDYPAPIIDLGFARQRVLDTFRR